MEWKLTVMGRLPGMNEYTEANRLNHFRGAEMKRTAQNLILLYVQNQLGKLEIHNPVRLDYSFYEKDRRRDMDNIAGFAHKVVQDALVVSGVLYNDGWKYIVGFSDSFYVDTKNPRIEITIREVI